MCDVNITAFQPCIKKKHNLRENMPLKQCNPIVSDKKTTNVF